MTEGVRAVAEWQPPAVPQAEGSPDEEVPYENFVGREELIGQDVPGAQQDAICGSQSSQAIPLIRSDREIVFDDSKLAIQEKTAEGGVAV